MHVLRGEPRLVAYADSGTDVPRLIMQQRRPGPHRSDALTILIEPDLKAAFILAKPANVLKGSLLPVAHIGVSRG